MWFVWTPQTPDTYQILRTRIVGSVFLLTAVLLFRDPAVVTSARWAVLASVLSGVVLNFYDIVHPGTFSSVLGRSAGIYINPNISGASLLAGYIITVGLLVPRMRAYFTLVVLLGVVMTLSRGALICALAVLAVFALTKTVSPYRLGVVIVFAALIVASSLALSRGREAMTEFVEASQFQLTRLGLSSDRQAPGDELATSLRREVAERSWSTFLEHPLIGTGTGSTGDTTHNMYLMLGAENGILGLLLFPLLGLVLIVSEKRNGLEPPWAFLVFLILWGVFSHNVLEDFGFLLCLALAPMIPPTALGPRTSPSAEALTTDSQARVPK
jgi:O-antigen ligase